MCDSASLQQVRDMAGYLGIDPDSEPALLDIARMAVAAPVPSGWQQIDTPDGYAVFRSAQCRLCAHNHSWWIACRLPMH